MTAPTIIKQQEQALFAEWSQTYPDFITDGLVDEAAYMASPLRVVFALKDAYDGTSSEIRRWDLCDFVRTRGEGHTWATVARWCYGLQNIHRDVPWAEVEPYGDNNHPDKLKLLSAIGVMNMKKVPSRHAATNMTDFREFTQQPENLDYIKRQWNLYQPQLTICASWSPFEVLAKALGASPTDFRHTTRSQRYWVTPDGQFLLEACHPAAQYPAAVKYYMVLDAARELTLPMPNRT